MKILLAAPHYPPRFIGGAEKMTHRMAHALLARGHQVAVVCVESVEADANAPVCVSGDEEGVRVHRLAFNHHNADDSLRWGYRNPIIQTWLEDFLEVERPDLVHLLSGYLVSGSVLEAAYGCGIPSVVTLLDFWFVCPLITLQRANGDLCPDRVPASRCAWCLLSSKRRFRTFDQALGGFPGDVFTFLGKSPAAARFMRVHGKINGVEQRRVYLKDMLERADAVITHSHFLQQKISQYGISTTNMVYLPNGIEGVKNGEAHVNRVPHSPLRIGYLGQVAPHKGVDVLVKAFIASGLSTAQAELHIYGSLAQWPKYAGQLSKYARGHGNILFDGPYPAGEVDRILNGLDVIVVPSVWFENRPTVILEAFSRGVPVIASRLGGMAEMVRHTVDGFLFEAGNAIDLASQLRQVVETPGLLEKLSQNINQVKASVDEMDEVEALYERVLAHRQLSIRLQDERN